MNSSDAKCAEICFEFGCLGFADLNRSIIELPLMRLVHRFYSLKLKLKHFLLLLNLRLSSHVYFPVFKQNIYVNVHALSKANFLVKLSSLF